MTNYTINNLSALSSPSASDYVPLWNVAGAVTRKVLLSDLFAAVMATANIFTASQTIAPVSTTPTNY
jgi:hypothetical protein